MKTLKSMERDRQLWVRLGTTLFLTEDEYQKIMKGDKSTLLKVLKTRIMKLEEIRIYTSDNGLRLSGRGG